MISADWNLMRAEAEILIELLRTNPPPAEAARIADRAVQLQQLGWAARELLATTENDRRKMQ